MSIIEQQLRVCTRTTAHAFHFVVILGTLQPDTDTRALSWLTSRTRCSFTFWVPQSPRLRSVWHQHNARVYACAGDIILPTSAGVYVARAHTLAALQRALAPDKGNLLPAMARLPTALFDMVKWRVQVHRADLDPAAPARFRVVPQHGAWRCASTAVHATSVVTHATPVVVAAQHAAPPAPASGEMSSGFVVVNGWRTLDSPEVAAVDNMHAASNILFAHPAVIAGTLVPLVAPMWLPPCALEWWAMVQLCMQLVVVQQAVVWHTDGSACAPHSLVHAVNCARSSDIVHAGFWRVEPNAWLMSRRSFLRTMDAWRRVADDLLVHSEQHAHLRARSHDWMAQIEAQTDIAKINLSGHAPEIT